MNKTLFVFAFLCFSLLIACKNETAVNTTGAEVQHASKTTLAGHWFALDFCARAGDYGSVLSAMNNAHRPYAYAFTFTDQDSVICFDGAKSWKLAMRMQVDTIELTNAKDGKSVFFVYDPAAKELTLYDATVSPAQTDRFIKSGGTPANGYQAFASSLNHHVFQGNWQIIKGKNPGRMVQFSPSGSVKNLDNFNAYALCTVGDCFVLGDAMDVVTMANTQNIDTKKMFGYRFSRANDTLSIYNLNIPDPKQAGQVGALAFQLLRKAAVDTTQTKK